ncbi:hypothetical protein ACFV4N_25480, partial [Actinosynnema sp. NPDC059797]
MTRRLGLRGAVVLTVAVVTVVTTVAMATTAYLLQAGATRERFADSAQASFDSDAQQAHQFLVRSAEFESVVAGVAEYMRARLGLTWAVVNRTPTSGPLSAVSGGMYVPVEGTGGRHPGQLPASTLDALGRGSTRYEV